MKTKNNYFTGFLIGFLGAIIIAGLFFYASTLAVNRPTGFNPEQKVAALQIYDRLNAIDFANDYPDSPEAVMDAYADTVVLLYGEMIEDDALYADVIALQRQLFSEDLLAENTAEAQLDAFIKAKEKLVQAGAYTVSVEHDNTDYYQDGERYMSVIEVTQYVKKMGMANWRYYLEDVDGRWKITSWAMTDENFNEISAAN
jgi:hypothetical protein